MTPTSHIHDEPFAQNSENPKYNCSLCQDSGVLPEPTTSGGIMLCSCGAAGYGPGYEPLEPEDD